MKALRLKQSSSEQGFTLMEIVVATSIFVIVVTSILVLFNYVLQINRRVQAVRQVAQGSRNFTEVLSREIRNGRIDYSFNDDFPNCHPDNYAQPTNQSLALTTFDGTSSCLYLDEAGMLNIQRRSLTGQPSTEVVNPTNFSIDTESFHFIVRPTTIEPSGANEGVQPMVTILAEFVVFPGATDEQVIPYQTTISSDAYDIPAYP